LIDWISFAGAKRLETTADIPLKKNQTKKGTHTYKSARHNMDIYIF
jgi:hypothetical protein